MDPLGAREQIETALDTIPGLRVTKWGTQVAVPAALVTLPERVDYHQTYGVGSTRIVDMMVLVLASKPDSRTAVTTLLPYAAETGPLSIKAVLEGYAWTALDVMTVTSVDFDVVTYEGTSYLAAMFHLDIIGRGAV